MPLQSAPNPLLRLISGNTVASLFADQLEQFSRLLLAHLP